MKFTSIVSYVSISYLNIELIVTFIIKKVIYDNNNIYMIIIKLIDNQYLINNSLI